MKDAATRSEQATPIKNFGYRRNVLLCTLALALVTVWLYVGIFPLTFMSDGVMDYIQGKRLVENDFFYPFYGEGMWRGGPQYYRPLPVLSHGIDAVLFGYNPAWHRATQMLLHFANVLLVFALFRAWLGERGKVSAMTGAFVFALHPLHEMPMWWPATRNDVMCCTFFLLAVLAFTRHVRTRKATAVAWSALAAAAALACKEMAYTLPLVCFMVAVVLDETAGWRLRVERAIRSAFPLAGVAACFLLFRLIRYDSEQTLFAMQTNIAHLIGTIHTAVRGLLFPFHVSLREVWSESPVLLALVGVVILATAAYLAPRLRSQAVLLGILWLGLTCLPIMRTMSHWSLYVPSVGFCLAAGHLLAPERSRRGAIASVALAVLLVSYFAQWESRKRDWQGVDRVADNIMETLRADHSAESIDGAIVLNLPASLAAVPLHAYYFAERVPIELADPDLNVRVLSHVMYPLDKAEQGLAVEFVGPGVWRLTVESPNAHFVFTEVVGLPYRLDVGEIGASFQYAWGTAEIAAKHPNGQVRQVIVRLDVPRPGAPVYYFHRNELSRMD